MKKILATLVAFAMVMAMYVPAVSATNVIVNAVVGSAGNPPAINYQFALSDDGDEPLHATLGTQILPLPGVGITESKKYFKKYVVVSDPNGVADIASVYEQLKDPLGNLIPGKPEVTATDITGDILQYTAALDEALHSNLITAAERTDIIDGLNPSKARYKIYVVENYLTNHDAPGKYIVYFKVVDNGGGFAISTTLFVDWLSLKAFELDFSAIDYGSIVINSRKVVAGDALWNTLVGIPPANRPTIKNQGNVPVRMQASATNLVGALLGQVIPPSALSVELLGVSVPSLSTTPTVIGGILGTADLQVCTPTQIDFDITAPSGTSTDTYLGTLTLEMAP